MTTLIYGQGRSSDCSVFAIAVFHFTPTVRRTMFLLNALRPTADYYAHFSFDDIDDLREFVETGLAQKLANGGNSRVILSRNTIYPHD
jgi:hypothetical protein